MGLFGRGKKAAAKQAAQAGAGEQVTRSSLDKFYDDAAECIRHYSDGSIAFFRMSVGNIGAINDTYGRDAGDKVLQTAANVFESVSEHALVARDRSKFVMMIHCMTEEELTRRAAAIQARLSTIGDCLPEKPKIYIHTGYFSTEGRLSDKTIPEMVECAKIAESEASKRTHSSIVRYTEQLRKAAAEEQQLIADMEDALRKKQFYVCLQPKFDMQTGEVVGAKIMSRWLHPKLGIIGSYRYVPLFVKNGFILKLDLYLFEQACAILKKWISRGLTPLPLSMNVPRILVEDQANMDAYVTLKNKYRIPDGLCELEFSERLVDDKVNTISDVFNFFRSNGFLCSVENFGAGNASISTIAELPINLVKFSRDYFNEGIPSAEQQAQIRAAIAAAKKAGIQTSATGVPDEAVPMLRQMGIDMIQGSITVDPLAPDDFQKKYIEKE